LKEVKERFVELTSLIFNCSTEQLLKAKEAIDALSASMLKLGKAEEEEAKSAGKATKTKQDAEQAAKKKAKADEEEVVALSAKEKMLQKAADKAELLRSRTIQLTAEEFKFETALTAGQAAMAAQLKIIGGLSSEFSELNRIFTGLNKFANVNPFDHAIDGLSKINREIADLQNVKLFSGLGLNRDQIQGLTRDIEKLNQSAKEKGASDSDLKAKIDDTIRLTSEQSKLLNSLKQQAEEESRLSKQRIDSSAQMFKSHQLFSQQEESNYNKDMQDLKSYFLQQDTQYQAIENSRKESFTNLVQIHKWKQEQDERMYQQDMQDMRAYYSQQEAIANEAERELRAIQNRIDKEIHQTNYMNQGASRSTANVAAGMQTRGVPQDVIDSFVKEANAKELSAKKSRELASAQKHLYDEDARVESILNSLNAAQSQGVNYSERGAVAIAKYEVAMQRAGIAGKEYTDRLNKVKLAQDLMAQQEQKRQSDYIARGVGVQMGDVGVSLAGGMNPLLVMIQQGDQLRSLIQQAGRDGLDLKNVMNDAAAQIVRSFKDVGIAVGTFVSGAFISAGKSIKDALLAPAILAGRLLKTAFSKENLNLDVGPQVSQSTLAWRDFTNTLKGSIPVFASFAAIIGGTLLIATYQFAKAMNEMNSQLIQFGASTGLTLEDAIGLANGLTEIGISSATAMGYVGDFMKSGITNSELLSKSITEAIKLNKYLGISVEDTAKKYADISKKPTEALIKIAEDTGRVTVETLREIHALEEKGKYVEAITLAQEEYTRVTAEMAERGRNDLSDIEKLWIDIKSAVSQSWGQIQQVANNTQIFKGFRDMFAKIKLVIQQAFTIAEGFVRVIYNILSFDFSEATSSALNSYIDDKLAANAKEYSDTITDIYSTTVAQTKAEANRLQQNSKNATHFKDILKKEKKDAEKAEKDAERLRKQALKDQQSLIDLKNKYLGKIEQTTEAEQKYNSIIESDLYTKYPQKTKDIIKADYEAAKAAEIRAKGIEALSEVYKSWMSINKGLESSRLDIASQSEDIKLQYELLGKTGEEYIKIKIQQEESAEINKANLSFEKERLTIVENYIQQMQKITTSNLVPGSEEFNAAVKANADAYESSLKKAEDNFQSGRQVAGERTNLKIVQHYDQIWKEIQTSISEAIYSALFEGGKKGGVKLKELLKAQLKKLAMEPINLVVNFVGSSLGLTSASQGGIGGILSGGSSGLLGALSNLLPTGVTNTLSNIFSTAGSGLGLTNMLGSGLSSLGAATGMSSLSSLGMGMQWGQMGVGMASSVGGLSSSIAALGSTIAKFAPWAGAAMVAYQLIDSFTGSKGGPKSGGDAAYNLQGALSDPGLYTPNTANTQVQQLLAPVMQGIGSLAAMLGGNASSIQSIALGYDTDPSGTASNRIKSMVNGKYLSTDRDLGRDDAALQAGLVAEVNRITIGALKELDLADWADSILVSIDPLTASAEELASALSGLNNMASLAETFNNMGLSVNALSASLITSLGGADNAKQALAGYFDTFYTEGEKFTASSKSVQSALSKMDSAGAFTNVSEAFSKLVSNTTKENFRALVEAASAAGDSQTVAGLLQIAPAFSNVTAALGAVVDATGETVSDLNEIMNNLLNDRTSLQRQILELQGGDIRALDIQGYSAAEIAAYDYNEALRQQVEVLQNAKSVTSSLTSESKSLERRLVELQGGDLRAIDTAGMDSAQVAIFDYNASLKDQIKVLEDAGVAVGEASKDIAGISFNSIVSIITDGMLGRMSESEVGEKLSEVIVGGVYNALVSSYATQITDTFITGIIQPMVTAVLAGQSVANAVSSASINSVVLQAQATMQALGAVLADPAVQLAMKGISTGISGIVGGISSIKFKPFTPASTKTSGGSSKSETVDNTANKALEERSSLERKLLELQGNTVELRRLELLTLSESNRALQQQIWAIEDATAISNERLGLEKQLLELQGDTVALRDMERNALFETNRALYDQVEALRLVKDIANERSGLEKQLLELQGNTTALRELERNALHESNRELYDQIKAIEDSKGAIEGFSKVSGQFAAAWKEVTDSLLNEVKRIRSVTAENSSVGYKALEYQFYDAVERARSGSQEAAKDLVGYSNSLLAGASGEFGSSLELIRYQAQVAGALEETAYILGETLPDMTGLTPIDELVQENRSLNETVGELKTEVVILKQILSNIQSSSRRTADATNGQGEAPMVVVIG